MKTQEKVVTSKKSSSFPVLQINGEKKDEKDQSKERSKPAYGH